MEIMVICDICGSKSVTQLIFTKDHQTFDLCETHREVVISLLVPQEESQTEKKRGRTKKDE
jgi:hypothetical protein